MLTVLQLITLLLVAITMTCSLGHALELPGKLRLPKQTYFAVQTIYYPGFTFVGGIAEIGAIAFLAVLTLITPRGSGLLRYRVQRSSSASSFTRSFGSSSSR